MLVTYFSMTVYENIDCAEPTCCVKSFQSYLKLCQEAGRDRKLLKLSYHFTLNWTMEDWILHNRIAERTNNAEFYLWFFDRFVSLYRFRIRYID